MVAVALCVLFVLACGSDNSEELAQPPPTATATTPPPPTATATTSAPPTATATPAATGSSIAFVSMSDTSPYGHDETYVMNADDYGLGNLEVVAFLVGAEDDDVRRARAARRSWSALPSAKPAPPAVLATGHREKVGGFVVPPP